MPNRKLRWGKVVKDIKKNKNLLDGFGRRREKNKRAVLFVCGSKKFINLDFGAKSQIGMGLKAEPVLCAVWISLNDLKLWFLC